MACTFFGLTVPEALLGMTRHAAQADEQRDFALRQLSRAEAINAEAQCGPTPRYEHLRCTIMTPPAPALP